jgi:uncharacterized membrane protein YedE/YeeE
MSCGLTTVTTVAGMDINMNADAAIAALCGGAVLGGATIVKLAVNGNILGISGIVNGMCSVVAKPGAAEPWRWRLAFLAGFVLAGGVLRTVAPATLQPLPVSMTWLHVGGAGALVGFGSSLGGGCTSGHGISGLTRLSVRSIAAVATFMATGILTASVFATSDLFGAGDSATPLPPPVETPEAIVYSLALLVLVAAFVPVVSALAGGAAPAAASGGSSQFESPDHPARLATEVVVATVFGLGLGISGMGRPEQVISFLDVHEASWDPTLALVMGAALCVTVPLYHLRVKRDSFAPVLNCKLDLPPKTKVDAELIVGAVLFGAGWGLSGVCPGPALICIFAPAIDGDDLGWPLNRNGVFIGSMLGGTLVHMLLDEYVISPLNGKQGVTTTSEQPPSPPTTIPVAAASGAASSSNDGDADKSRKKAKP